MRASRATLAPISGYTGFWSVWMRVLAVIEKAILLLATVRAGRSFGRIKGVVGAAASFLGRREPKRDALREESPIFLNERDADGVVPIPALLIEWWLSSVGTTRRQLFGSPSPRPSDRRVGPSWAPTVTAWNIGSTSPRDRDQLPRHACRPVEACRPQMASCSFL
jgi:hypothetical protein